MLNYRRCGKEAREESGGLVKEHLTISKDSKTLIIIIIATVQSSCYMQMPILGTS